MPDPNTPDVRQETVADIPDLELLRRAAKGTPIKGKHGGQPRWSFVMRQFQLGSTYAWQLCERCGLDGDERVRRAP